MKTLQITTTRVFKTPKEWEDYKYQMQQMSEINFTELEETGHTELTTHHPSEVVSSKFELYDPEAKNH